VCCMARDPTTWLAANVRLLIKRIEFLEKGMAHQNEVIMRLQDEAACMCDLCVYSADALDDCDYIELVRACSESEVMLHSSVTEQSSSTFDVDVSCPGGDIPNLTLVQSEPCSNVEGGIEYICNTDTGIPVAFPGVVLTGVTDVVREFDSDEVIVHNSLAERHAGESDVEVEASPRAPDYWWVDKPTAVHIYFEVPGLAVVQDEDIHCSYSDTSVCLTFSVSHESWRLALRNLNDRVVGVHLRPHKRVRGDTRMIELRKAEPVPWLWLFKYATCAREQDGT